jgi:hypothetical protein
MESREIDARLAELMGWEWMRLTYSGLREAYFVACDHNKHANWLLVSPKAVFFRDPGGYDFCDEDCVGDFPSYSTSLDAMAEVEREIERRGLMYEYWSALCDILINEKDTTNGLTYLLLTAPPAIRAQAALKCMEG